MIFLDSAPRIFMLSFATAWNETGSDLRSLMAWVGWKNPATALKYQSPRRSPPALLMQHWLQDEDVQRQLAPASKDTLLPTEDDVR